MKCPKCQSNNEKVIDSRDTHGEWTRRRRRICIACNHRWTTTEIPTEMVSELIELAQTHLAIEEAYRDVFGKSRCVLDKVFGRLPAPTQAEWDNSIGDGA